MGGFQRFSGFDRVVDMRLQDEKYLPLGLGDLYEVILELKIRNMEEWSSALGSTCPSVCDWLQFSHGHATKMKYMHELSFFDDLCALRTEHLVEAKEYTIKRVIYKPSAVEKRGNYYASDVEMGGLDTFWKLQLVKLSTQRMSVIDGRTGELEPLLHPRRFGGMVVTIWQLVAAERRATLDAIDEFCNSKPGVFVHLGGVGDRP